MKNMKKILVLVILFSGFAASSFAQVNTANADASASILAPISIAKNLDMSFGNLALSPTGPGGTVVLAADNTGTRNVTGGIDLPSITGLVQAAKFTVTGEGNSAYAITGLGTISLTYLTNTMSLVLLSNNPSGFGTLYLGGDIIYVGGTLTVFSNQVVGSYTGSFDVIVNYE